MASERIQEWQRHWPVALGAAIVAATGLSVWSYVASGFVEPLQEAFGWSRGQLALASFATLLGALAAPIVGKLADRYGVRPVLSIGVILVGLCYLALANNPFIESPASFIYYFVFYAALAITGVATSSLTFTRAVASWFDASRGIALSSTRIGLALVAWILPSVLLAAMNQYGWQAGFYVMAALTYFICLPAAWFLVKDRRDDAAARIRASGPSPSFGQRIAVFANWRVLVLSLAIGAGVGAMISILSQLQPMLVGDGISRNTAAWVAGLVGWATVAAAILVGFFLDRVWGPLVGFVATLAPVAGCLLLRGDHVTTETAIIAVACIGLAAGAEIDIVGYLTARYFGIKSYGLIYGTITMVTSVFIAASSIAIGKLYDAFGDYKVALTVCAVLYGVSAVSYLLLGPYPKLEAVPENPVGAPVPAE